MEALILYLLGCVMAYLYSHDMDKHDGSIFVVMWPVIMLIHLLASLIIASYSWVRSGKFDPEFKE